MDKLPIGRVHMGECAEVCLDRYGIYPEEYPGLRDDQRAIEPSIEKVAKRSGRPPARGPEHVQNVSKRLGFPFRRDEEQARRGNRTERAGGARLEAQILRGGRRSIYDARQPHEADPGRNLQRGEGDCRRQRIPNRGGPRLGHEHHLRLAQDRYQQ